MTNQERAIHIKGFLEDVETGVETLDLNTYQAIATKFAQYPNVGNNFVYPALGLCGEAGEVAEKIKKVLRDKGGTVDFRTGELIKKELGDVLWYVADLCNELHFSLGEVAMLNLTKLVSRLERDVLQGEGDNR